MDSSVNISELFSQNSCQKSILLYVVDNSKLNEKCLQIYGANQCDDRKYRPIT